MARDKIFISYRRDDAAADAQSVYQYLARRFGKRRIFMDVDSIQPGQDFRDILKASLARTRVLLVLIGPRWNENGRLHGENDFVRLEVREALSAGIPVIPVTLGETPLPAPETLPEDVQPLIFRHKLSVRYESFGSDMAALERALRHPGGARRGVLGGLLSALALAGGLGWAWSEGLIQWPASGPDTKPVVVAGGATASAPPASDRKPDETFRDCSTCPEMVVIPAGSFMMGAPADEPGRDSDEGPQHRVSVQSFALGVTEVTFDEWASCVADGYCTSNASPSDRGWGRGTRPVINVSWNDITGERGFIDWMNSKVAGAPYRLPSEAEWEYAARAGTTTPFWTGQRITTDQANFNGNVTYNGSSKGQYREKTLPVGSFATNALGLHDVLGNVWEWVGDCWNESYSGAPSDGSVWTRGDCSRAVLRGGSWGNRPQLLRSADRFRDQRDVRFNYIGFRVARTLPH